MTKEILYVTNLAETTDEDTLRGLFGDYGEVSSITFGNHRISQHRYALVQMTAEKNATRATHGLNGQDVDGFRMAVSYPDPDYSRILLPKQRKAAETIVAALNETEEKPVRMIHAIVLLCGVSFAEAIAAEAQEIYAGEGIMTSDGSQRRTLGGVFFYLCRYRMSDEMRKVVYNRKGKLPQPTEESTEETEPSDES